jgi:hypothetical protein
VTHLRGMCCYREAYGISEAVCTRVHPVHTPDSLVSRALCGRWAVLVSQNYFAPSSDSTTYFILQNTFFGVNIEHQRANAWEMSENEVPTNPIPPNTSTSFTVISFCLSS